jgi:APA family basic amino acid/polyamine antiporter
VFVHAGAFYADPDNWEPFMPYGVPGIFSGCAQFLSQAVLCELCMSLLLLMHHAFGSTRRAALIFFAYIGFDSISAAAEECKNPQRDLPIGACLERPALFPSHRSLVCRVLA